jgi:hypothetical protein
MPAPQQGTLRAAYVRMSADYQHYSTVNHRSYRSLAAKHNTKPETAAANNSRNPGPRLPTLELLRHISIAKAIACIEIDSIPSAGQWSPFKAADLPRDIEKQSIAAKLARAMNEKGAVDKERDEFCSHIMLMRA